MFGEFIGVLYTYVHVVREYYTTVRFISNSCFDARVKTHCKEISIHVFPEKELRGLSPNFYIHGSLWAIYIFPRSVHLLFLQQNMHRSQEYINRTQKQECWNWVGTVAAQFLSWENMFGIFGIVFLQCMWDTLGGREPIDEAMRVRGMSSLLLPLQGSPQISTPEVWRSHRSNLFGAG